VTTHLDAVSVVDQSVENAVGQGWIADLLVPAAAEPGEQTARAAVYHRQITEQKLSASV
jgi:hypothetical protein